MNLAVIGGGYSGTMLVHHLLARVAPHVRVFWFEKHPPYARGVAYSTPSDAHLLNVAAQNMSTFADAPHDFIDWLAAEEQDASEFVDAYLPRRTYQRYIKERADAMRPHGERLCRIEKEVIDIRALPGATGQTFELIAADASRHLVDGVALCIGHFPPMAPRIPGLVALPPSLYIAEPWDTAALDAIDVNAQVACLGAGLSMVDVVLHLAARRFEGQVVAVSRKGQWPHTHTTKPSAIDVSLKPEATLSAAHLVRWLRARIDAHVERGGDWRQVIDGLRPHTKAIWRALDERSQARLLRHGKSLWDAHRHRVAPHVGKMLAALRREGRLLHHAGRLERCDIVQAEAAALKVQLSWRLRRSRNVYKQQADVLINCTGVHNIWPRAQARLPRAVLGAGLVSPGPHHIGLHMTDDGRVCRADGTPHARLWAMGPVRAGMDFESVAVPELRVQAQALASVMADACVRAAAV